MDLLRNPYYIQQYSKESKWGKNTCSKIPTAPEKRARMRQALFRPRANADYAENTMTQGGTSIPTKIRIGSSVISLNADPATKIALMYGCRTAAVFTAPGLSMIRQPTIIISHPVYGTKRGTQDDFFLGVCDV
jgi:hypothetical protein